MSESLPLRLALSALAGIWLAGSARVGGATEILVADRLTNSVYRYSSSGQFLGTLLTDNTNLNAPTGIQLSPNLTKLYVASSQNNELVQYDYNYAAGTATNPTVIASSSQGLDYPSSIQFDSATNKIYVANLDGGVVQLNPNGSSAGPLLVGSTPNESMNSFSGLGLALDGSLVVGGFQDASGSKGGILKSNLGITTLTDFVGPTASLFGAGALAVKGNNVYITSLFSGRLSAYNLTTGVPDPAFTPVTGLAFPESIAIAPDGNSLLVGILGFTAGQGKIAQYSLSGTSLGTFATAQSNPALGFREATAFVTAPPPPAGPGTQIGYFSRDAAVSTMVNSPTVRSAFLSNLMSLGTENLESSAGQAHPVLSFGTTGITATTDFDGAVVGPNGSSTSGDVSLLALPTSSTQATHSILFSSPVTAFGAYFLDGGQTQENVLTLELVNTITGTSRDVVVGTLGPNWGSSNVFYFGVIDAAGFNRVVLLESYGGDQIYLDDITAGFQNFQSLIVPANATVTLEPSFDTSAMARTSTAFPAVPEPASIVLAGIALAIWGWHIRRRTLCQR